MTTVSAGKHRQRQVPAGLTQILHQALRGALLPYILTGRRLQQLEQHGEIQFLRQGEIDTPDIRGLRTPAQVTGSFRDRTAKAIWRNPPGCDNIAT